MKQVDKSHALIDGILLEYDVCLNSLDTVYRLNYTEYEYLGQGVIDNVCGRQHLGKEQKYFYKKIIEKKKRSSW
jgi:hypothetical protein